MRIYIYSSFFLLHVYNIIYFMLVPASRLQIEEEVKRLKEELKMELLGKSDNLEEQLEMINTIERIGVGYHFEEEIDDALQQVYEMHEHGCANQHDLYHVSLQFRILRQHGFHVSSDVFKKFKEDGGAFKGDVRGILSLYEASHVGTHGDIILDEAAKFTTTYLKSVGNEMKSPLAGQVALALHQCFHKGMNRVDARRHVTLIEQDPSRNKPLLMFAKLDFNLLQLLHQEELSDIARWWKGLHSKIPFARDRSVEPYFWAVGIYHEPKYSIARKILAKLVLIIQLLDDTYDAFASIQSLEPLTHAIDRWEYSCMDSLPDDVKVCYQVLLQTFDEFEHDLAEQGRSFYVNYAKQQMKLNNKAWWQEAKWCHEKCIPSYDEYMQAALVSIGHVEAIIGSYLGMESTATKEVFEWVCQNPNPKLIKESNIIFRLMNDIGGYKHEQSSRDHVASSVECYMKQHGIEDEKQTIEELERQVEDAWKDVNQAMLRPFEVPKPCLDRLINLVRAADVMYKGRTDGYTMVNENIMKTIAAVLVHAIPL